MIDERIEETLRRVARFYDQRKVGDVGGPGFRRSSDLARLASCLIGREAGKGALFMVYGLERILPRFGGLRLLTPIKPLEGILALYQKE